MSIKYTRGEERTNYLSHAGGILLGIIPYLLLSARKRVDAMGGMALFDGNAGFLYCINSLPCMFALQSMERKIAQVGSCSYLLAHCG